jgi:hypothetical protein
VTCLADAACRGTRRSAGVLAVALGLPLCYKIIEFGYMFALCQKRKRRLWARESCTGRRLRPTCDCSPTASLATARSRRLKRESLCR